VKDDKQIESCTALRRDGNVEEISDWDYAQLSMLNL
jgi:hypothetical protein